MATQNGNTAPVVEKDNAVPLNNGTSHHHYETQHNGYGNHGVGVGPSGHGPDSMAHHGHFRPYEHRKFANPAPLGLSAFALTTFVLSCVNMHARGEEHPNIAVSVAYGYGGLVQLLAGMWEMAVGNTLGATALSSYGGFWISYAIILTPAWGIVEDTGPYAGDYGSVLGFFLTGWFIFTTIILLCTLKSSVAFFVLFFTLDLAFLFLMCEQYALDMGNMDAKNGLQMAGGFFGFLAAFAAWYNALAGLQDSSNSFFQVPLLHFPWSDKGKELRKAKSSGHVA